MIHRVPVRNSIDLLLGYCQDLVPPPIRSLGQFVCDEIVIPDGPYKDLAFNYDFQPYTRLLFQEIDSGRWRRFAFCGPTQSGKTFSGYVAPACHALFELKENIIIGLPDMKMANDKWRADFLPVISKSRYANLLPTSGEGSRGGDVKRAVTFENGATLRFMTGGGGDKQRAGATTRIVLITEVDGLDEAGEKSDEADKVTQLEARTRSHGRRGMTFLECTVTTKKGRIWEEYSKVGSCGRIVRPCPKCLAWVTPGREHLIGWQDAEDEKAARERAAWSCPECKAPWTEEERLQANIRSKVVHKGQEVTREGEIVGPYPRTETCGFRWTAVDNQFRTAGDDAVDEWHAQRAEDPDNAERKLCQFVHAVPIESDVEEFAKIDVRSILARTTTYKAGTAPRETDFITVGADVGKYLIHYEVLAWLGSANSVVIQHGIHPVPTAALGIEKAVLIALRELRDNLDKGWPDEDGVILKPRQVWVDSGWATQAVYAFVAESGERYRPVKAYGSNLESGRYRKPKQKGRTIIHVGENWHATKTETCPVPLIEVDADEWKSWVHARLQTPVDQPGAMVLHEGSAKDHLEFAKHIVAEKLTEEYEPGTGMVKKMLTMSRHNHRLDASAYGCCAGNFCGARLITNRRQVETTNEGPAQTGLRMPDGRPYLITERR